MGPGSQVPSSAVRPLTRTLRKDEDMRCFGGLLFGIVVCSAVGYTGGVPEGEQCAKGVDPCWDSRLGLLDMALEPMSSEAFIFGTESDTAVFENEVYEVLPRDLHHFGSLNFSSHMIFRMMESIVSIDHDKLGQPAVHGEDYYLVKRVKGKDGEWWSGRVPDAHNNASAIYRWFRKGFTLVLNNADSRHVQLAAVANGLEDELGYIVQLNAYLTPPTSQGFEVHWDPMETLIIQLEGQKTWSIYDPIIELPRPEQRFKPTSKQVNHSSQVQMHMVEGAALYLPRGWLHEATTNHSQAQGQHSLHLTIGIEAQFTTWEQVLQAVLVETASARPEIFNSVHRIAGSGNSASLAVSARSLMHWAIRGAALQVPLLRRALLPRRGGQPTEEQARAELETCGRCLGATRGLLSVAAVEAAVEALEGKADLQLQRQVGEEAVLFEDADARRRLLERGGGAEAVLAGAAEEFARAALGACAAGVEAVREAGRKEVRRRQGVRRERLRAHGMACAEQAAPAAAAVE